MQVYVYISFFILISRIKYSLTQCSEFYLDPDDYVGCIEDFPSPSRVFPGFYYSPKLDNNICILNCKDNGFRFAGTEDGGQCFCGNDNNWPNVAENECNKPCVGNASQICGGSWRISVYRTGVDALNQIFKLVGHMNLDAAPYATVTKKDIWSVECALHCKSNMSCGVFLVDGEWCKMYRYEDLCSGNKTNAAAEVFILKGH